ncbi:RsmD family RNA methyltransferase [Ancylomarina longa]|uniref:16S rRNA (Guanine(966)-N(2))-methyltransferase RsmD n=1 Tax=Ancylomarina longa TaxID=2487017 RepID=A0A434AYJ4_9BACT|nr:RsmD family RNA methyltransferase [Ancylomarina longa]RUT79641.1 16S rRNA (guanine(966)-N(2))-methyltransferase RsmD [Ancylomarina longa]
MRIVSGTHKGRRIHPDKNFKARPTTDFAKENLFNVLHNLVDFEDLIVLDLFGGTGGISYEFASRGAKSVICVELDHKHFLFIQKTIGELELDQILPIRSNVFRFLKTCHQKFDMIFADPPYDLKDLESIPDLIIEKDLLNAEGILIVEHSSKNDFSNHPSFMEKRTYGSVNFSFFQCSAKKE